MNFELIFLDEVESTNSYLQDLQKRQELEEGQWVQAAFQTAGRGQRSKEWFGESGSNLYASLLLKPTFLKVEHQFRLNLFISLALRETVQHFCSKEVQIKWPNDILVDSKKISGVLIENSITGSRIESAIIGIGVNINQMEFPAPNSTSIRAESGGEVSLATFFELLKTKIEHYYSVLSRGDDLLEDYLSQLYGYKKEIQILKDNLKISGELVGLDENGCLLFQESNGSEHRFCSGQISFLL